jgi:hypothetical protein
MLAQLSISQTGYIKGKKTWMQISGTFRIILEKVISKKQFINKIKSVSYLIVFKGFILVQEEKSSPRFMAVLQPPASYFPEGMTTACFKTWQKIAKIL